MNVLDAIEMAENNSDIKTLKDFFLGSAFACIKDKEDITKWTILFYNPKTKNVIDCFVNEKSVIPGEETVAMNVIEKLEKEKVKVSFSQALETAKEGLKKNIVNILITLHTKGVPLWSIAIVSSDMTALAVDIDAETGKVIKREEKELIRRL